jgi:hypothetical protein
VLAKEHAPDGGPDALTLAAQPARLGGPLGIGLAVTHLYAVVPTGEPAASWRVSSRAYHYELTTADGRQLLRYDWHPTGRSAVTRPHVHLRRHAAPIDLSRAHVPTGRVSPEAVVRFAIEELGVPALRSDWRTVLDEAERSFVESRTWA